MSDLFSGTDLLGEFDRLQRQMTTLFVGTPASLRVTCLGTFPPVNIGSTDDLVEIIALAPGLGPAQIDVSIDKGLLTINDERKRLDFEMIDDMRVYADERFTDTFRHAIELPQDVDPDKVSARYVNGCLTIGVGKSEASGPHQITMQD